MVYKKNIYEIDLKSHRLVIANGIDNAGVDCIIIAYDGVIKSIKYYPIIFITLDGLIQLITRVTGVNPEITVEEMIKKESEQRSEEVDLCTEDAWKTKLIKPRLRPKYVNYKHKLYKGFSDTFEVPPSLAFRLYKSANYHAFIGSVDERLKNDIFINNRGVNWSAVTEYHKYAMLKKAILEAYEDNLRHIVPILMGVSSVIGSAKSAAYEMRRVDYYESDFRIFCKDKIGTKIWKAICKNSFHRNKIISRHQVFSDYVSHRILNANRNDTAIIYDNMEAIVKLPSTIVQRYPSLKFIIFARYILGKFSKVTTYADVSRMIDYFYFNQGNSNNSVVVNAITNRYYSKSGSSKDVKEFYKDYLYDLTPDIIKNTAEFRSKYKLHDFFVVLSDTYHAVGPRVINMSPRRVIEEHRILVGVKLAKYILSQAEAQVQFLWINYYKGDITFTEPNTQCEVTLLRTKAEVVEEGLKMHHCVGGAYSTLCSSNDYMVWTLKASRDITIGYRLIITPNAVDCVFDQAYYAYNEVVNPDSPDGAALYFAKKEIAKRVNVKNIDIGGMHSEVIKISYQACTV